MPLLRVGSWGAGVALQYWIEHRHDIRDDRHYALRDDGEIIEIIDDQKPKRGGDLTGE
ncbi:MAG: hypothetical protein U0694_21640 [Anaerolineae bacterium]